jgi:hypothetical protein
MLMKKFVRTLSCFISIAFISSGALSQSPGIIVRPSGGIGVTVLNPNGDSWSSSSTSGFATNDITESEIVFKVVPPIITEPTGDLATGPSAGFSDIVKTVDNSGFYIFYDGTNLLMRLRIGNIISGSKGYSILFDTDGKMGNSGPGADPNYVAATNTSNGNPGFEYEVVLETNFGIVVYNVDGVTNGGTPLATYAINSHSQISVALSADSGTPDYFYDFYVPVSILGNPASFRMAATTVTSPTSALQGSRSDIYGLDDASNSSVSTAWQTVINAQPSIILTDIATGGSGVGAVCTAAPALNSPINTGSNVSVSGTWTRMDVSKPSTATITVYKNGSAAGTTSVSSGGNWNIIVSSIAIDDVIYAKAQAAGESQCLQSDNVTAGCSSYPTAPSFANATINSCASSKGMRGTVPLGATVEIYEITTSNNNPYTTQLTTNLTYTNLASERQFDYYGTNAVSGNPCNGNNAIFNTSSTYMLISNLNGCKSAPVFGCIVSGGNQNSQMNSLASNSLSLTTPVYPFHTSVSGTGATSGQVLRLYTNGEYTTAITATGSSFSFTGLSLKEGDQLIIYAQAAGTCATVSSTFTVSCYTQPPSITTNTSGNLLTTATSISGTSAYPGVTVSLYKGASPTGTLVGSATVNSSGVWTVSSLTLTASDSYYATQLVNGCTSAPSTGATVSVVTTVCPSITGSYSENNTSVSGTTPSAFTGTIRLYLDGTLIGSTTMSGATNWSIAVNQNTTTYIDKLYANGVLTATAQASGAAEKTDCGGSTSVSCATPTTPVISPTSISIYGGQTVTFTVQNAQSGMLFSIRDNGDAMNLGVSKFGSGSDLLLTSTPFNTAGAFTVRIKSTSFSGAACESYTTATVTVLTTLPVNLLDFTASYSNNVVSVDWKTSSETNVSHYEVERSYDGNNFSRIGQVNSGNFSEAHRYHFTDNNIGNDVIYYRLKIVDIDGKIKYSRIAMVRISKFLSLQTVQPNPFKEKVEIRISSLKETDITFQLIDVAGKKLIEKISALRRGINSITINALDKLAPGVYILVLGSSEQIFNFKLIKE